MSEPEQIVNTIARQTKNLMASHWPDIDEFRDGDEKIKVGFSHYISYQGQERIVESKISFGKRMTDTVVDRIDTDQMRLELTPASMPKESEKPVKRRGRPPGTGKKHNVLEMTLKNEPKPDNAA